MNTTLNRILKNDIDNSYCPMDRVEELDYVIQAKAGNHVAQNKLVNSQLKRIVSIARAYANQNTAMQDLISEGTIGLIHAITMYDISKANDVRFYSYAQWWIRDGIANYVCDNQLIRLPRSQSKGKKEIRNDDGEIIVERTQGARVSAISINAPLSDDDSNSGTFESTYADETCLNAETMIEYKKVMDKLKVALTPRELEIYEARIIDQLTYEEIGERFGFNSREATRLQLNRIIAKVQTIDIK